MIDAHLEELLQSLNPRCDYYFCNGIPPQVAINITFEVKNLRRWDYRVDHQQYLMWFKMEKVPLNLKFGVCCTFYTSFITTW